MKKQFYINGIPYDINCNEIETCKWGNYLYYNIETIEKNGIVYAIQYTIENGKMIADSMALYEREFLESWDCRGWHDFEHYATPQEAEALHNYIKETGLFFAV
jgi:hypothetical protein